MSVSFNKATAYDPTNTCSICLQPLGKTGVIAHNGGKEGEQLHQIHEQCIKVWLKIHPSCPSCRVAVNTKSLLSLKERAISAIKNSPYLSIAAAIIIGESTIIGASGLVASLAGSNFKVGMLMASRIQLKGLFIASKVLLVRRYCMSLYPDIRDWIRTRREPAAPIPLDVV